MQEASSPITTTAALPPLPLPHPGAVTITARASWEKWIISLQGSCWGLCLSTDHPSALKRGMTSSVMSSAIPDITSCWRGEKKRNLLE
ncbi:hypothetical protein Y1Q_0005031 [Alligator mississippiensis]|uniref:Uncharacterized protein n=1 Tax=Alligator mississippiensis TaxID=8496 RepID=A0A151M3P4_ALLMI|nr:hypothetical protein Y1Q_0005031 [Alligator mississippiensis]